MCVAAAALASRVSRAASAAARYRRRAAREELKRQREQQQQGNSFDIVAASNAAQISTSTSSSPSSATLPCLSALVLLLCAAVFSLSCWGIIAAATALRGQPRASWQAASGAANAASAALVPGDAAVTLARQTQSGLLSLAESLPAIVSTATGGDTVSSSSSSSTLLASLGLDVPALQADATSAAAAAGTVADRGGDAAAAVRSALTEGLEKAKSKYETRSEHAAAAATAGALALTLGFLGVASLALGAVSFSSVAAAAVCLRGRRRRTSNDSNSGIGSPSSSPPRTRSFLLAAAMAFVAASLGTAAGLAGGAVAAEASRDVCLYGETAVARLVVSAWSSGGGGRNSDLASRLALFYLDGDAAAAAANKNASVFSLLGITPDLERLLLSDGDGDTSSTPKAQNGTLKKTAALGGAALALLQTDVGRNLVAKAGLPARERRSILNLPDTVVSLRARVREFEKAAAPSQVAPSLLSLKKLPCCVVRDASAPWAAASMAGGFVLAAAASLACFAGVAAAAAAGVAAGAPQSAPATMATAAAAAKEEHGTRGGGEEEREKRVSCGCWPRRYRRRDGFFRSRDAAAAESAGGRTGDQFEEEVERRPWPTL